MEGSTVLSFLSVMTTMQGACNLCSALAKSSVHLPRYWILSLNFSDLDDGLFGTSDSAVVTGSGGQTSFSMVCLMIGS